GGVAPGVRDVSIHVRYGEFFTLLGPPKSGKSDVLRAVAGFLPTTAGRVLVDGQDISTLPAGRRDIGYVFQDGALWPHMSVGEHIAFGLELRGLARAELERKIATVAGRLGLGGLVRARPTSLNVDQRRRLAIARALAPEPRLPLLDEPLANIDPIARMVLRPETLSLVEAAMAQGPGIPGQVALRVFEGARHLYEIEIGGQDPVRVEVPSLDEARIFRLGDRVRVEVSSDTVVLIPVPDEG